MTTLSKDQIKKLHDFNYKFPSPGMVSWAFMYSSDELEEIKGKTCYGTFVNFPGVIGVSFPFSYDTNNQHISDSLEEVLISDESPWRHFIREAEIEPTYLPPYLSSNDRKVCVGMVVKNTDVSPQSLMSLAIFLKHLWISHHHVWSFSSLRDFGLTLPEAIYTSLFLCPRNPGWVDYLYLFQASSGDLTFSMNSRMEMSIEGKWLPSSLNKYLTLAHLKNGNIRINTPGQNLSDGRAYFPVNPVWGEFLSVEENTHGEKIYKKLMEWIIAEKKFSEIPNYCKIDKNRIIDDFLPMIKEESNRDEIL